MIIKCENCSRKFVVKDKDIPIEGRTVQCGYCSVTWHQMPPLIATKTIIVVGNVPHIFHSKKGGRYPATRVIGGIALKIKAVIKSQNVYL